jgi:hypothetical protein
MVPDEPLITKLLSKEAPKVRVLLPELGFKVSVEELGV